MALLTEGYWQTTYWASSYWADDYWQDYGMPKRRPMPHVIEEPLVPPPTFELYIVER